jgi:dTDP-4-dehydrorhamnose 3,5-epimerase
MKFIETPLKGAYIIEAEPFTDHRGVFARTFCKKEFLGINHTKEIVQVNYSATKRKGSIRGMHYQLPPMAEIKIVRCVNGSVFDVIVDLRKGSPTFLKWFGAALSKENMKMMYVPEGFAHGFQALEDDSDLIYMTTQYFSKEQDSGLNPKDTTINIKWPVEITEISEKDDNKPLITKNFKGIDLSAGQNKKT